LGWQAAETMLAVVMATASRTPWSTKSRWWGLVEALRRDGLVQVGVAKMTIRLDLDQLVERGVARRMWGCAVNMLNAGGGTAFRDGRD
jgi:hypothetical protein